MRNLIVLLAFIRTASAAEPSACPAVTSPQAVLECVLRIHPAARSADALLKQSDALVGAAGQRPNPEAEANALLGNSQDQVQVSVLHTFETAGKRSRRIDRARAEGELLRAEALAVKEELAVDTAVGLHRLRQIRAELRILKKTLAAFSGIAGQLRSRPRRSPEQQVSMSVFRLAERDYALRRSGLESEEAALRRLFELGLGTPLPDSDAVLPKQAVQWPELGAPRDSTAFRGSAALRAAASVAAAQAEIGVAQAASYPDVRLGPSIQSQKNGPGEGTATLLGAGLSLALPLYQRNVGGRLLAARSADTAAARSAATLAVLAAERDAALARYRAATAALAETPVHEDMEADHKELDGLFERGLISSALVIEAHRQLFDFTSERHQQELSAVRALWTIYAIEGRALTEIL